MLTQAGLEEVENVMDRRLLVNRVKRLTMHRCEDFGKFFALLTLLFSSRAWLQCKYRKPT
jgi:hypothetical protein